MVYIATKKNDCVIVHSGTKGMKWGVRKYQNEDGTLTAAGKERYLRKQSDNLYYDWARRDAADKFFSSGMPTSAKQQYNENKKEREKFIRSLVDVPSTGVGTPNEPPEGVVYKTKRDLRGRTYYSYDYMKPENARKFIDAYNHLTIEEKKDAGSWLERQYRRALNGLALEESKMKENMPTSAKESYEKSKNTSVNSKEYLTQMKNNIPASAWNNRVSELTNKKTYYK